MRGLRTAAAVMMLAVSGFCAAAMADTPQPRRNASPAELADWADRHILLGPYVAADLGPTAVALYDPIHLEKTVDGTLLGWLRTEFYRPVRAGRAGFRSVRERVEFDCVDARLRRLAHEFYPEGNLQGQAVSDDQAEDWSESFPEDHRMGMQIRQLCGLHSLVGSADWLRATPPTLYGHDPATLRDWLTRHIDQNGYTYLAEDGGEVIFYETDTLERLPDGPVRATIRTEILYPLAVGTALVRSALEKLEIDCPHFRYRTTERHFYPGSNLLGAAHTAPETDDWTLVKAGEFEARYIRAACRLATEQGLTPDAAMRQPPIPDPEDESPRAVVAWALDQLNLNGFVHAVTNGASVYLFDPRSIALAPGGNLTVRTRFENPFEGVRSTSTTYEIDCRSYRIRALEQIGYAEHNLEDELARLGAEPWTRALAADTPGGLLARFVCGQRSLVSGEVDPDLAFPPTPADQSDAEIDAWIDQHLYGDDYVVAAHDAQSTALFSLPEMERTRQDHIRVWTRYEYFEPRLAVDTVIRSTRVLVDIDCEDDRWRLLASESYPGSNLQGAPVSVQTRDPQWTFIPPGALIGSVSTAVCDLKDEVDAEAAAPQSPLNSPAPL